MFYVPHPRLQVFIETVGVVIPPGVAGFEVEDAVVAVASVSEVAVVAFVVVVVEPEVVFVSEAAALVVAAVSEVVEPAVFASEAAAPVVAAVPEVAESVVAFVVVGVVAGPQASVGIALAFDVSVPVSVVAVEVDSPGCPRFLAFPNVDYSASSSSSVQVAG
ncbi:MAG TPA: hypothetical protein VF515_05840 [Candidatus Binatia bacterium]